jgi:hypothetical protein
MGAVSRGLSTTIPFPAAVVAPPPRGRLIFPNGTPQADSVLTGKLTTDTKRVIVEDRGYGVPAVFRAPFGATPSRHPHQRIAGR